MTQPTCPVNLYCTSYSARDIDGSVAEWVRRWTVQLHSHRVFVMWVRYGDVTFFFFFFTLIIFTSFWNAFCFTFGKFFRSYSELLSKFGDISFQEYLSKGISHPVFYGDLVYKLRRVKDTPNFIVSGSKIVKRLRRRQYEPVIIERTIGLVLGPSTALYEPFLKHCTLTNKAVGTIWWALSKPPQRRHGPDICPLWLLVGTPSAIRPELAFIRTDNPITYNKCPRQSFRTARKTCLFRANKYRG